ncbi:hypothetical protein, conserved [Trypanosoma brucei brucei TREU927]|uniref:Uncharacterized protein n=1 Tax=Trypanosoma brucei brucei (strain 927/4 GUTat10.1) TaxID=185431 RepID=Q57Z60_TRYB2|nr:hypothetical protein, conserved [Trypanosoma brucei brucei TREU927]AAX79577.1 hypothetical protein, conserved [Trypanosoma brucei]AAZ11446.1 hypothetical protein, conserved [Trypanosoma brucei brucei TREU927]
MAGRLRDSLSTYFSKHIDCGDWRACLRVLRGCEKARTSLRSLPYKTLFPFLVANGQWEFVLRLSSQFIAVNEKTTPTTAGTGAVTTDIKKDDEDLCNVLLGAALASEAVISMGSWRAVVMLVRHATEQRLQLEPDIVRSALRAMDSWQQHGSGQSSNSNEFSTFETDKRREQLMFARNILLANASLTEEHSSVRAVDLCNLGPHTKTRVIQVELLLGVRDVFEPSDQADGPGNKSHWLKLQGQMSDCFTSSWEDAVYTLLRVCTYHEGTPREVGVEGNGVCDNLTERCSLNSLISAVANNANLRPQAMEHVLQIALEQMLDGCVIRDLPTYIMSEGKDVKRDDTAPSHFLECNAANLLLWCAQLRENWGAAVDTELLKWRAVLNLVILKVEQRRRQFEFRCSPHLLPRKSEEKHLQEDATTLIRLCASARLVLLDGGDGEKDCSVCLLDNSELKYAQRVLQLLMSHGALVIAALTHEHEVEMRDAIVGVVVDTVRTIMTACVNSCRVIDGCRVIRQPTFGDVSKCSADSLSFDANSVRTAMRRKFWTDVFFPNSTLFLRHVQKEAQGDELRVCIAWQELLRELFAETSALAMWFGADNYVDRIHRESEAGKTRVVSQSGDESTNKNRRNRKRDPHVNVDDDIITEDLSPVSDESMKQIQQLVEFLSRRFTVDICGVSLREGGCFYHQHRDDNPTQFRMGSDSSVVVPGLSEVLKRQESVNDLASMLAHTHMERNSVSVPDITATLGTLVKSIADYRVKGLLEHMLRLTKNKRLQMKTKEKKERWQLCRVAVAALVHESGVFPPNEKTGLAVNILEGTEPSEKMWELSLALFAEATISICAQKPCHNPIAGDCNEVVAVNNSTNKSTTLVYIMDVLVSQTTPPRWREALQVVETASEAALRYRGTTERSVTPAKKLPLSESEHIDLFETVDSLKQQQQWVDAVSLFTQYEARLLSSHDIAGFSFAFAHAPLSFIRIALLALGHQQSRGIAQAALTACARRVRHLEHRNPRHRGQGHHYKERANQGKECNRRGGDDTLCEENKDASTAEDQQRRCFVLHEVRHIILLALQVWPVPVVKEVDFTFIWKTVLQGCGGDVEMAYFLLNRSFIYKSPELHSEIAELTHMLDLCHRTHDVKSAASAYREFRRRRMGLRVPEESMLKLLELCVMGLNDEQVVEVDGGHATLNEGTSWLLTVLLDVLSMHDSALYLDSKHNTSGENSVFVRVCVVLFSLRSAATWDSNGGNIRITSGIPFYNDKGYHTTITPIFTCTMKRGMRHRALSVLHILLDHLVKSHTRFLRDISSFVGVLLSIPPEVTSESCAGSEAPSEEASFSGLVEVLIVHVEELQQQFGDVVPVASLFWLKVLHYSLAGCSVGRKFPARKGSNLSPFCPSLFVAENNAAAIEAVDSLLKDVVTKALDETCHRLHMIHKLGEGVSETSYVHSLRRELLPCSFDAIIYTLCRHFGKHPSLSAFLSGAALMLQQLRELPTCPLDSADFTASYSTVVYGAVSLQGILSGFYARQSLLQLAVGGHPSGSLSATVEGTFACMAHKAAEYVFSYVKLLSAWILPLARTAEVNKIEVGGSSISFIHTEHVRFLIQLVAKATGTCAAWGESSHKEKCMFKLQRLCDSLSRLVFEGAGTSNFGVTWSTRMVLRVLDSVLRRVTIKDVEFNNLLKEAAVHAVDYQTSNTTDSLQSATLAVALIMLESAISMPNNFLQDAVLILPFDAKARELLQGDASLLTVLVVVWLIFLGVSPSLIHRVVKSLVPFTPQFIANAEQLLLYFLPSAMRITMVSELLRMIICSGENLVELLVLGVLVTNRQRDEYTSLHAEEVVFSVINAVGATVPNRWDLALAAARGCSLVLSQPQRKEVSDANEVLVSKAKLWERLAVAIQSCGPWPRGVALQTLLEVRCGSPCSEGRRDDKHHSGLQQDYVELLRATSDLNAHFNCSSLAPPQYRGPDSSPLRLLVQRRHQQIFQAASIVLGNARQKHDREGRQRVLGTLLSCDSSVQFVACERMASLSHGIGTSPQKQRGRDRDTFDSWIVDCVALWPWEAISNDTQHFIIWSYATLKATTALGRRLQSEETQPLLVSPSMALETPPTTSFSVENSATVPATTVAASSVTLNFPRALFGMSWAKELRREQSERVGANGSKGSDFVIPFPYDCKTIMTVLRGDGYITDVTVEDTLLAVSSGFSCLQYVYALFSSGGPVKEERELLLFIAGCCRSMQEVAHAVLKRLNGPPPLLDAVISMWNVLCIRRVEFGGLQESTDVEGVAEAPLDHNTAALFVVLAVGALRRSGDSSLISKNSTQQQRQLIAEMFAHTAIVCGGSRNREWEEKQGHFDEALFRKRCVDVAGAAIRKLGLQKHWHVQVCESSFFDDHINLAIRLVRDDTTWISLWPPMSLELSRCRRYVDGVLCSNSVKVDACQVRHPKAICWLMEQCVAASSRFRGEKARLFDVIGLLDILQGYILRGVAYFTLVSPERSTQVKVEDSTAAPLYVRGTAAGLVVDQFASLAIKRWSREPCHWSDHANIGVYDVIRNLVDAIFPRTSRISEPPSGAHSFLSGYAPVSTTGVVALTQLLVVREDLEERRTVVVDHVVSLLKLEQRREATRLLVANDVKTSSWSNFPDNLGVEIGRSRQPCDLKDMLLFHVRALVASVRFVNPLGWHDKRQLTLDTAYTALLDFLLLYDGGQLSLREVDIVTGEVESELEKIFGSGVRRVILASRPRRTAVSQDEAVTVEMLLDFLNGKWKRQDTRRQRQEVRLHYKLHEILASHNGGDVIAGAPEILLLDGEEMKGAEFSALLSAFPDTYTVVQKALWSAAVVPSHDVTFKILDAAVSGNGDVGAICAALQVFATVAPYMVVTTMMLEKVLVLLIEAQKYRVSKSCAALCRSTLDLILRRFQYVPLNTPEAVAMMAELYALLSAKSRTISGMSEIEEVELEHLLWRCVVESDRVERAPLEDALSLLEYHSLKSVHRGCRLFLLYRNNRPHYDPPFLRLGRMLDALLIFRKTPNQSTHVCLTEGLLKSLEKEAYASPMHASSEEIRLLPWRRSLRFMPDNSDECGVEGLRCRFFIVIMTQLFLLRSRGVNAIRHLWKEALVSITRTAEKNMWCVVSGNEHCRRATELALRTIHIAQPLDQWVPALNLVQRLPAVSAGSTLQYFRTVDEALSETLRYVLGACSMTSIPIAVLVEFLRFLAAKPPFVQLISRGCNSSVRHLNCAQMLADLTKKLQKHPYLGWIDGLAVLQSLSFHRPNSSDVTKKTDPKRDNGDKSYIILREAKAAFVTATMQRMYKRQAYEPLLRFVEAAQQTTDNPRIRGRDTLAMLEHAASVVFPISADSNGPWVILSLLNGTLIGKTVDDMLREQSSGTLSRKERHLHDLLRNGQTGDAAVVARQAPQLLQSRATHDACVSLIRRFHHSAVVHFYDELLHGGQDGSECMYAAPTTYIQCYERVVIFRNLPADSLTLAVTAFEVASNCPSGLSERSQWTGVFIAVAWLRAQTNDSVCFEPLALTLRWVQRDVPKTVEGPLSVLEATVQEILSTCEAAEGNQIENDSEGVTSSALRMLCVNRTATRLLVEILSGVFPTTTSRLCGALQREYQKVKLCPPTEEKNEWLDFLCSTAAYNEALYTNNEQYKLLARTPSDTNQRNTILFWRNREIFRARPGGGSSDWLSALAAYVSARSYIGRPCVTAAQATQLVNLMVASGSLGVVVTAARDVFLFSPEAVPLGDSVSTADSICTEALSLLFSGLHSMKRQAINFVNTETSEKHLPMLLQNTLNELEMLNHFVEDVLERLQEKESVSSTSGIGAFWGNTELGCHMIGCLALTPIGTASTTRGNISAANIVSSLERWRLLLLCVLNALPPHQRHASVLNAVMVSIRDAFVILNKLQKCPVPAVTGCQEALKGLWCDALSLVASNNELRRCFFSTGKGCNLSQQGMLRQDVVDALFHCASLTGDRGLNAMKALCDSLVRPHGIRLSEEAMSLLKVACINNMDQRHGLRFLVICESLLGGPPLVAQRQAELLADDMELQELEYLSTVEKKLSVDCAKLVFLVEKRRAAGVRLQRSHYRKLFLLLEERGKGLKPIEMADAVMFLYFSQLQDGSTPDVRDVERLLHVLSRAAVPPLLILQYAKAMTLIPYARTGRNTGQKISSLPRSETNAYEVGEMPYFIPSEELLVLITDAAWKLRFATQEGGCASADETQEGIQMFASFLEWSTQFSRIHCFKPSLVESIVLILCTLPEKASMTPKTMGNESHAVAVTQQFLGDVRVLLPIALSRTFGGHAFSEDAQSIFQMSMRSSGENIGGDRIQIPELVQTVIPTQESLCELRNTALAAAHVIKQQMMLHSSLPISSSLLCRVFAAAVAGCGSTRLSQTLEVLSQIARDDKLITPPLRYLLALTVAEQSVLWDLFYKSACPDVEVEGVTAAVVVHYVSKAFDIVRLCFAPKESLTLGEVLLPCSSGEGAEDCNEFEDKGDWGQGRGLSWEERLGEVNGEPTSTRSCDNDLLLWEKSLQLFGVFFLNARPKADLSVPFVTLLEILCRCGQWSSACKYVARVGAPGQQPLRRTLQALTNPPKRESGFDTSVNADDIDTEKLLSQHVVVDGFLLERLVRTVYTAHQLWQRQHVVNTERSNNIPLGFWRLALHLLEEHKLFVKRSLIASDSDARNGKAHSSLSPSTFAVMMKIRPQ